MKKANSNKRKSLFFLVLFALCLCFFNVSCGLDVLKKPIDDPFSSENQPNIESTFDSCYFYFSVSPLSGESADGKTQVFYKIYNDDQKVSSEESSLISMADDSIRKANSAQTMIETYGYKELCYLDSNGTVKSFDIPNLDKQDTQNKPKTRKIRIRLTNYTDDEEQYSARISVDGEKVGVPVRMTGKTFDFGRSGENDENPMVSHSTENASSGDTKGFLEKQDESEENIFYVAMFAVYWMYDEFYETNYSPVHFLGRVKIDANVLNN